MLILKIEMFLGRSLLISIFATIQRILPREIFLQNETKIRKQCPVTHMVCIFYIKTWKPPLCSLYDRKLIDIKFSQCIIGDVTQWYLPKGFNLITCVR